MEFYFLFFFFLLLSLLFKRKKKKKLALTQRHRFLGGRKIKKKNKTRTTCTHLDGRHGDDGLLSSRPFDRRVRLQSGNPDFRDALRPVGDAGHADSSGVFRIRGRRSSLRKTPASLPHGQRFQVSGVRQELPDVQLPDLFHSVQPDGSGGSVLRRLQQQPLQLGMLVRTVRL